MRVQRQSLGTFEPESQLGDSRQSLLYSGHALSSSSVTASTSYGALSPSTSWQKIFQQVWLTHSLYWYHQLERKRTRLLTKCENWKYTCVQKYAQHLRKGVNGDSFKLQGFVCQKLNLFGKEEEAQNNVSAVDVLISEEIQMVAVPKLLGWSALHSYSSWSWLVARRGVIAADAGGQERSP